MSDSFKHGFGAPLLKKAHGLRVRPLITAILRSHGPHPPKPTPVTSAMVLGAFAGSSTAGSLQETVGRRRTIVLAVSIYLLGVALSFMAPLYAVLLLGRLVTGMMPSSC